MNIKDIFKEKKKHISMTNDELLDVPKIIFEDLKLQVTIGQWLGVLSSMQGLGNSGIMLYSHLSAEELIKKTNIPVEKFEEIAAKFGIVLKLAGIENTETCFLNQFDKDNFSFNCRFNNSGNDAKISLRWGSIMDFGPKFIIDYPYENKTYEFYEEYKGKPIRLSLQHYTIKNPENGNSFYRYLSQSIASFTLTNGEYSFSITIEKPESVKIDIFSDYIFKLENEEQLQQYLLGLTFPLEINEIYKKICEISMNSVIEYPSIKLEVKRNTVGNHNKRTDLIYLNYGQLKEFIITKEGKTITIGSDDNWSFDSEKIIINQSREGNINYSLNSVTNDELFNVAKPIEQYNEVSQEVEQVKKLVRNMLNK